jgi:hypothetical protein
MNYEPRPIRTDTIRLDDELLSLVERLAENTHNVWACGRRDQGWRYGVERNDTLKTHPCLVSYEQLPEREKEFDRATVIETLKVITALGYRILAPPKEFKVQA